MGGREPAQAVAPLQTKPFHVEIDETGDGVIERRDGFRSGRRTTQSLADDARQSTLCHHAARRARDLECWAGFRAAAEFARSSTGRATDARSPKVTALAIRVLQAFSAALDQPENVPSFSIVSARTAWLKAASGRPGRRSRRSWVRSDRPAVSALQRPSQPWGGRTGRSMARCLARCRLAGVDPLLTFPISPVRAENTRKRA